MCTLSEMFVFCFSCNRKPCLLPALQESHVGQTVVPMSNHLNVGNNMVADGKSTKTNKTYTDDDRTRKQVLDLSIIQLFHACL